MARKLPENEKLKQYNIRLHRTVIARIEEAARLRSLARKKRCTVGLAVRECLEIGLKRLESAL
jgi:hypothetical protein